MNMGSRRALRLLIVDDNADDRFAYRRLLAKIDEPRFELIEADSGEMALAALAGEALDFVLLDLHLPDANGIELLRTLRAQHPRLPVVMLTGLEDVDTSVAALQSGADDYLVKGRLNSDNLLRVIRGALERRALETQLAGERERLELFYRLVEQSGDLLLVIRMPERRLIECNQAAVRQLGYSRQTLLDETLDLSAVFPNLDRVWETLTPENPERRLECHGVRADGRHLPLEVSASRVAINEHEYFVAVARDITDRQEVEAQLRRLVLLDGLTGVHNRRAFDERFEQEFLRAARGHGSLALLMIDVDHFKSYNDTYGHQAGDKCLRQVAQALVATLKRPSDFVARYGGEEFAVLLPDADVAGARAAAGLLVARVAELALPHSGSPICKGCVSISIGVAVAQPPVRGQLDSFMASADQRLYRAKQNGRNCVVDAD